MESNLANSEDPFKHHPELRDRIVDPNESFFRDFNARAVFQGYPELHWVLDLMYSDAEREALRCGTLNGRQGQDLWVFAYGSLMWDPALRFSSVRRAFAPHHQRRFILKDIYGGRGTRQTPGLMAALDTGEGCEGVAYRIPGSRVETETQILWSREMFGAAYKAEFIEVQIDGQSVEALSFVADHQTDVMCPELTQDEQVRLICTGSGFLGTSHDYLKNILDHFEALGIVDEASVALFQEVERNRATGRSG
jgi:cation transport protein ChaC